MIYLTKENCPSPYILKIFPLAYTSRCIKYKTIAGALRSVREEEESFKLFFEGGYLPSTPISREGLEVLQKWFKGEKDERHS